MRHRVGAINIAASTLAGALWEVFAMTDPHQAEAPADGESATDESPGQQGQDQPDQQDQASVGSEAENSESAAATEQTPAAEAQHTEADSGAADSATADSAAAEAGKASSEADGGEAQGVPAAQKKEKRGLTLGLASGAVGLVVGLVLGALVGPHVLPGPGKPDGKASEVVAALASKNPGEMEKVSCHSPDGKPTKQLPPQALQLIQSVKSAGAPQMSLDTEAQAPVDLTLSAQGQTQTIPIAMVLGVSDGQWCMKGITQRQQ